MEPIAKTPLDKNDISNLIDMALKNKMPWNTLAYLLNEIITYDPKQVVETLLEELKNLHRKMMEIHYDSLPNAKANVDGIEALKVNGKEIIQEGNAIDLETEIDDKEDSPNSSLEIGIVDDDIEFLEVVKERVEEDADLEFNESTTSFEHNSENYENELGKEIDNEWYTFVTNTKACDKLPDKPKNIADNTNRENEVPITTKDSDSTSKASSLQCTSCLKSFSTNQTLKRHEMIHLGEVPFECKTCKKRFRYTYHLKSHERIHTGEKPYKCKTCVKTFSQSNYLK